MCIRDSQNPHWEKVEETQFPFVFAVVGTCLFGVGEKVPNYLTGQSGI